MMREAMQMLPAAVRDELAELDRRHIACDEEEDIDDLLEAYLIRMPDGAR